MLDVGATLVVACGPTHGSAPLQEAIFMEGWPRGLRRTLGKRVMGNTIRAIESLSFRQSSLLRTTAVRPTLVGLTVEDR